MRSVVTWTDCFRFCPGRTFAFAVSVACAGCTAGSDDDSDNGGQVAIAALSHDPTSQGVAFDSAELSLHLVSLVPCASDTAVLYTTDFSIELLHEPWPRVIFVSAATGFCGVDLNLAPAPGGTLPDLP